MNSSQEYHRFSIICFSGIFFLLSSFTVYQSMPVTWLQKRKSVFDLCFTVSSRFRSIESMLPDSKLMICGSIVQFDLNMFCHYWAFFPISLSLTPYFCIHIAHTRTSYAIYTLQYIVSTEQQTIIFPLAFVWIDFLFTANETEKCLFCIWFSVPSSRLSHPLCYC